MSHEELRRDLADRWLRMIARDGTSPIYGRWQPAALDTLGLLSGHPDFEDENPERPIATRVVEFLRWAAAQNEVERRFSDCITDRLLEMRREIEANG